MARAYEIADGPAPPRLRGSVVVRESLDDLLDSICADLFLQSTTCVRAFGDFQLVVSPGPTAERVLTRLMVDPLYRDLPWSRTRVWLADEGRFPPNDDRSGFRSIADLLLGHAGVPKEQLHAIPVGDDRAHERYEQRLREVLEWRERGHDRPDFLLLTLGPRGGVAGLRPGAPAVGVRDALVSPSGLGGDDDRVTLTLPVFNASRFIAVIASGFECRDAVLAVERGEIDEPASRLDPSAGELRWYIDFGACGATNGDGA